MSKGNRQLPTKWALRFWLQRLRGKHDAKRGADAVQKRINAMFAVADAYVHQRCAAFLDEKHALFVEVAAYTPPHKQTPNPARSAKAGLKIRRRCYAGLSKTARKRTFVSPTGIFACRMCLRKTGRLPAILTSAKPAWRIVGRILPCVTAR